MEVMKKYIAFRIVTAWVKNHKVVKGFFALGQKDTDYNWDFLGEFDNMETAKKVYQVCSHRCQSSNCLRSGWLRIQFLAAIPPRGSRGQRRKRKV